MHTRSTFLFSFLMMLCLTATLQAQQNQAPSTVNAAAASPVPRLIKFSGTLLDEQGKPMKSPVGVTFALYAQQSERAPLWMETQHVEVDAKENYTVLLGANSNHGVPADLFPSGEARWLGVQAERQVEQPRVLLVSVPYALKAGDAETLGGKPASACLTAETFTGADNSGAATSGAPAKSPTATTPKKTAPELLAPTACSSVTSDGTATAGSIAKFTAPCIIKSSAISEIAGKVGIGTATPTATLDVRGPLEVAPNSTSFALRIDQGVNGHGLLSYVNTTSSNKTVFAASSNAAGGFNVMGDGTVGIGTATPGHMLEIIDAANSGLRVQTNTAGGTVASFGGNGDFQIDAPGVPAGRFVVKDTTGNVGIGTAAPRQLLSVAGTIESTANGYKFPDGTTQSTGSLWAVVNSDGTLRRGHGATGSSLRFTGEFLVDFVRDVTACAYIATPFGSIPVFVAVQLWTTRELLVSTFDNTGASSNQAVQVAVFC